MVVDVRLWTVEDYHRMAEAGIFAPEERVELIAGQILRMAAKGTPHSAAVGRTDNLIRDRLGNQVLVRLQEPILLDDYSEPEPDIAVVRPDPLFYEDRHPGPNEVYFIIEVSDTTFQKDYEIKAPVYGRSGVLEYWILDVKSRKLYVFRSPSWDGFQNEVALNEDDRISPLAFPELEITVSEMLRPRDW